jgi:hypothetical protein
MPPTSADVLAPDIAAIFPILMIIHYALSAARAASNGRSRRYRILIITTTTLWSTAPLLHHSPPSRL